MDAETRERVLGRLRFSLQHTPSKRFDVGKNFDNLAEIVEEEGPLHMAALHQMVSLHELASDDSRGELINDIIDLARNGVRCCEHPLCPINLLIDVAIASLAEGKQES